jgi:hypothetical protein
VQLSKLLLGLLVIISFILCVGGFLKTGRPSLADEASTPQPVSYSPMDAISSPSGSVARTEKIRMACYPVGGGARKIPTAVPDSVGQAYREPIATIRDIPSSRPFDADEMPVS